MICASAVARAAFAQAADDIPLHVTPDARGCLTEAALRARIASLRARAEGAQGLSFTLDASSAPEVLEVRRDDIVIAARRFDALPERCADRLQTVALVITLAIEHAIPAGDDAAVPERQEPDALAEEAAPDDEPEEPAPDSEPPAPPPIESDASEPPALRAVVGAGAAYGLLPELAGALAVGVELPTSGLWIGLGALVTSEASTDLAGGSALTRLVGARAYGCASGGRLIELQACAGTTLAVVSGSGRSYAPNADATGTLIAPLLRLGARYPVAGGVSVGLALEGFVHLVRPELQVSGNAGAVASVPPFGASLSIEGVLAVP